MPHLRKLGRGNGPGCTAFGYASLSPEVLLRSNPVPKLCPVRAHNTQEIFGAEQIKQLAFWFAIYLVSSGALFVLVHRYQNFERLIRSLANRLVVLAYVYVSVSLASVVVVFLRNI